MGEEIEDLIEQWTLANALEHGGNASVNAVIGKLIAEKPELKSEIQELKDNISGAVGEVNELSEEGQEERLEELGKPDRLKKEEQEGLADLPEADEYPEIVTRFAPNPNGPLHLGHIRTAMLSHEYARRNDGKFVLRFEDTNPEDAKGDIYDLIRGDLEWLGLDWDEEYIQSDRMEKYYDYAEGLLEEGNAYVCTCPPEKFKELRDEGEPCPCRDLGPDENLERWGEMLDGGYGERGAVVRIRTDLEDPNPALREWPALRIVTASHPRTDEDYRVWPLYNFSVAIDDHEMGVTHVLRGKEHEVNEKRQRQLFEHLGWEYPTAIQHGRLSISGAVLSKTRIMEGIDEGEFEGYDDVRLGTIAAVRRRGIVPEALRELITNLGITKTDSTMSWDTLYKENRRAVDEKANRYFFVKGPRKIVVHDAPEMEEAELRLHPDDDRGDRTLPLDREDGDLVAWIPESDWEDAGDGDVVRLKDLFNFRITSKDEAGAEFDGFELKDVPKIQWVSAEPVDATVLKPDGSSDTGYVEPEVGELEGGEIVQFERYGFVRIDEVGEEVVTVYSHS